MPFFMRSFHERAHSFNKRTHSFYVGVHSYIVGARSFFVRAHSNGDFLHSFLFACTRMAKDAREPEFLARG